MESRLRIHVMNFGGLATFLWLNWVVAAGGRGDDLCGLDRWVNVLRGAWVGENVAH